MSTTAGHQEPDSRRVVNPRQMIRRTRLGASARCLTRRWVLGLRHHPEQQGLVLHLSIHIPNLREVRSGDRSAGTLRSSVHTVGPRPPLHPQANSTAEVCILPNSLASGIVVGLGGGPKDLDYRGLFVSPLVPVATFAVLHTLDRSDGGSRTHIENKMLESTAKMRKRCEHAE